MMGFIGRLAEDIPTWLWLRRVFVYQVHASLHSSISLAISRTGVVSLGLQRVRHETISRSKLAAYLHTRELAEPCLVP